MRKFNFIKFAQNEPLFLYLLVTICQGSIWKRLRRLPVEFSLPGIYIFILIIIYLINLKVERILE
ncbi:MAG: hypothetical protein CO001_00950 [Candidatus Portnoybacteria bacterium CG_4_8_14_3_um_filter_40_10]|uniref:Uncharacterized protein n=3 Tax=Candidatus Portnoyibacteriota TaxID=1817913 RepID=A0A2M7IJ31_9BACT|nr:MAG: hypothetical protein COV84_00545 [Candidatus Portnoybacteria bacterium CG11_big_fil_rev_8_21_14_0_20_40_15]PIW76524.1 MAG: hypothetical protein CO001_00950 [Candidatus Portnoybacteria bacterium CG_4_8_14_3_um_filter_40_10]PJA64721.1 MAG: hypothetical protein CO159_01570 [Candidatus Portnoybacteria bacterium CG_4_9_14_3_um_filter_40_10]